MISDKIKLALRKSITAQYGITVNDIMLEHPSNEKWGDFATNIPMQLAKELKQSPMEIARNLSYRLESLTDICSEITVAEPGFINFKINIKSLIVTLNEICQHQNSYGSQKFGNKETVIIEYSQPNTNKPQHIGHARNNFLGSALSNILAFCDYNIVRSNYVGDIGIHICKSMLMYVKNGNNATPETQHKKSDHFVGDFYVQFDTQSNGDDALMAEARELLKKWEANDPETRRLWKMMNDWVYQGWEQTYSDQNVTFDIWEYESEHVETGREMAELAVQNGLATKQADGSILAHLEKFGLPDKILLRADGTTVYATKDIQLAKNSFEKYNFAQRLYVVDARQGDYFKQFIKVLELMGFDWANRLHHIGYGFVKLPEGNMSSRHGLVVNADDVFAKLIELEEAEIANDIPDKKQVARQVALAAFRYGLLRYDVDRDIVFDYSKVTKFEGNTGPYLLYTFVRCSSVLEKSQPAKYDASKLDPTDLELAIMRHLYKFPEVVVESAKNYTPNTLCTFLFDLCQKYNSFYNGVPILKADSEEQKNFRLTLTQATQIVLKNGLGLLGIAPPNRM